LSAFKSPDPHQVNGARPRRLQVASARRIQLNIA
jgi:hypothetical protein